MGKKKRQVPTGKEERDAAGGGPRGIRSAASTSAGWIRFTTKKVIRN